MTAVDPVRRLVQPPPIAQNPRPVATQRCDDCRDEVEFTRLVLREPWGLFCERCVNDFAWLREQWFGGES